MNRHIFQFAGLFGCLLFVGVSACDYIEEDINIDPNKAVDVSVAQLLPPAQTAFGYVLGGDFGRPTSIWIQHLGGAERQHTAYDQYQLKEGDVNTVWDNMYTEFLKELDVIIEKSDAVGAPHYKGVAQVMTVMGFQYLVDLFDRVPYSEALQGAENLTPAYDDGAAIYNDLQATLDDAINNLQAAESVFTPGAEDLIYGGDLSKWLAAAYAMKARLSVHLSEVDSGKAYNDALTAVDNAFTGNGQNAYISFSDGSPYAAFETDRGDVVIGAKIVDLMNAQDDPRRSAFFTVNDEGIFRGMTPAMPENGPEVSRFGPQFGSQTSPIPVITYYEVKFIEAEAALQTGDAERAAEAYNAAVIASIMEVTGSAPDSTFVADYASATEDDIDLEQIMTQKYIALFAQVEAFADYRRKMIPDLTPAVGDEVATRFPYPSDERLYNSDNFPGIVTVFGKVFWDQ